MTEWLDAGELAAQMGKSDVPAGAGAVAANLVALIAGLCESLARASVETWPEATGIAVQAATLRLRASEALAANAPAYAAARERLRPAGPPSGTGRDAMLRAALLDAADTLLAIGAVAEDCAELANVIVHAVTADAQPDAVAAAELATGAATTIKLLVDVNLALLADDDRREQADAMLVAARRSRDEARRVLQD